ncbi:Cys-tRNA(Pro) deacylase [Gilvimarinus agarilyticus]|uniref:Cys-tRNA(Pro) deacylase n=1 Tax=Gilvimarinus agarilyticus TaxID=679259 RepID=UPI00059F4DCF|nr:Cys-tRNA(Pro) deacylase [Gilvimarinus agarilyticus]
MTPAVKTLTRHKVPFTLHEYQHDESSASYGLEAAQKLNVSADKVFKTLVVQSLEGALLVGLVPVSGNVNLKLLARAAGVKKVSMAQPADVQRSTGYVLGGVSPLGQKKRLPTYIDSSAHNHECILISAGQRGLEIELSPIDLSRLCGATFAPIAQSKN